MAYDIFFYLLVTLLVTNELKFSCYFSHPVWYFSD
jgi:hypothetical protein